jgi:hypothetical protein
MATQPNWWESAPVVSPANDPSFTGFIPGVSKPKEPKAPVFVPKDATQIYDPNTGTYAPVPKAAGEEDPLKSAINDLGTGELLDSIARARDNLKSGWATGVWGALAEAKPGGGTPRDNFLGNLTGIKGSLIQDKLLALKQASKTGASGMGALSEKEGELLASSVAALTPDMSQEEYIKSFKTIAQHAKTLEAIRDGKDPRDPAVQREIQSGVDAMFDPKDTTLPGGATAPEGGGGTATPAAAETSSGSDSAGAGASIGVSELTNDQKNAYAGFWKTNPNPTPEQLKTFLGSIGITGLTNADEIIAAEKKGAGYSTTKIDGDYQSKVRQRVKQEKELGGPGPVQSLVMQGGTLNLSDEGAGVGESLANILTSPITGDFDPIGAYRIGRDAERMRIDDARRQLGYGGTALELASGLGSAGPGALEMIAPKAAAQAAGKGGTVGGALAGFGAGEGAQDSATGAAGGALGGYVLGRFAPTVISKGARLLPKRFRAPQGMAPDVANAAQAEGVDLMRPMVDPHSVSDYGALESNVYSQPIIRGASARIRGQIEDRVSDLAPGGVALEPGAAGDRVQDASRRFISRSKGVANTLYNRARAIAGPDATVTPRAALGQLRQELMSLKETPNVNQGELSFINELGDDLTNGPLTISAIRNLRTSIRGRINQSGLTATQADARANRVLDALQQDVASSLPPGAATAYRRADAFYRERMTHVDDVISRFLGPKDRPLSGEQSFARLKSMASPGGDGRRLGAIMRSLDGPERQDVAATIAQSLGRRSPDEPFSTALFVSQTSKLSPSARRTIFGPDGAQSIDNLRLLSRKLEEAEKDINRSRSATVLERQGLRMAARSFIATLAGMGSTAAMTGSAGVGIAGGAAAGGAMMASAARRVLSARAMVNPRVSRWLAEAADVATERQAKEATRKLGVIIAREPALANELQPVYQALQQRLSGTAMPLAANPQTNGEDNDR